ncbi:benenodin family lasso peptide [Novosphingobium rosa]|nr:benenodin family lasso peptide [Novosphingobium rosa]
MERNDDRSLDLIDLGAASIETHGLGEGTYDGVNGIQPAGLTDQDD